MDPVGMARVFTDMFGILIFEYACEHEQQDIVDALLTKGYVATTRSILLASTNGHSTMVQTLLHWSNKHLIIHDNNAALQIAVKNGYIDIVKILISLGTCEPRADNDIALRSASYHGYTSIVEFLLNHYRAEPRTDDMKLFTECLRSADIQQHTETALVFINSNVMYPGNGYIPRTNGSTFYRNME
jgi:ankyrin repeat protein